MNTEFNGRPERAAESEAQFWHSLEELLPLFEREGIALNLEAHPDDFFEDAPAASTSSGRSTAVGQLPVLRAAQLPPLGGERGGRQDGATRVTSSSTCTSRTPSTTRGRPGLRYILNPPGTTARVHQHLDIGQGEVDWDAFFGTLRELDFDGVATACVFAWEERARESSAFMRDPRAAAARVQVRRAPTRPHLRFRHPRPCARRGGARDPPRRPHPDRRAGVVPDRRRAARAPAPDRVAADPRGPRVGTRALLRRLRQPRRPGRRRVGARLDLDPRRSAVPLLLLLFPDGRPPSRRWWLVWLALAAGAALLVARRSAARCCRPRSSARSPRCWSATGGRRARAAPARVVRATPPR